MRGRAGVLSVLTQDKAQLWINHDKAERDGRKMAPVFYE